MCSKVTSAHIEGELSLFTMSDQKILDLIYTSHVHEDDDSFEVDSLFLVTKNIIKRSTQIIDNIVQGNQVRVETIDEKPPKVSFSSPLCTLIKSIGCELSCQGPGEEIVCKSILSILKKLSTYSWEAKAVLTLAAFALEYGEFWLLAEIHQSDLLANSVAILRRVSVLLKPADLKKRLQAVVELNTLIKTTLQVIEYVCIFEKKKLSAYDSKDVTALAVYRSIITIVACATKVTLLTSDEDKPHDLSQYSRKIHHTLNDLRKHLQIPAEVTEVFTKDSIQPIIDGSSNKTIKEEKYIFFYGGKDNEWIQQFTKKATAIANDPFIKELKINIALHCVGKSAKGGEDLTNINKQSNTVTKEVQKSYKNESGWAAVLSKGSNVVVSGHGFTILNVLQDFERWKELIKEKGLEVSFKTYHEKVMKTMKHCCDLDIPSVAQKVPETNNLPDRRVRDLAPRKAL